VAVLVQPVAEAERARLSARRGLGPACAAVVVALGLAACTGSPDAPSTATTVGSDRSVTGAGTASATASATVSATSATSVPTTTAVLARPRVDKVLVFVVENHSAGQMSAQMPYAAGLGRRYAVASAYTAVTHPSLPNYLAMVGGSTYGVRDDDGPARHRLNGASVFGLALAHGHTAGVYAEGMASHCQLAPAGRYAVKHNPWAYFPDERVPCRRFDQPLAALPAAITAGTLPSVGMVVPDLCHDAHDCSLGSADQWFAGWMHRVQAGPDWRGGRLLVVLTADEDDHHAGNRVLTVLAHPDLHQRRLPAALDHYALARLLAEAAGAPAPHRAAGAPSISQALGLRVG
jgi:Phosphoesterase family